MAKPWAGRRVGTLTAAMLRAKGSTCHLCGYPGAVSADHNPPRSALLRLGVANPDALDYLWPSHLVCNRRRRDRRLTDALKAELRRRYEADQPRRAALEADARRSSRWANGPVL